MTSETTKCIIVHLVIQFDEGIVQNIFLPFWPYLKCPVRFGIWKHHRRVSQKVLDAFYFMFWVDFCLKYFGTPGTQAIFLFL